MGVVLQSWASICAVPEPGTDNHRYLRHTLENIACFEWRCSKGSMDDRVSHGYHFDNACMTESFGVKMGSSATARLGGWGRNQLEARKGALFFRLGAPPPPPPLPRLPRPRPPPP